MRLVGCRVETGLAGRVGAEVEDNVVGGLHEIQGREGRASRVSWGRFKEMAAEMTEHTEQ